MRACERIGYILGVITVIVVFVVLTIGLARATGAPIPPRFGGYYYPPVVRNNCLLTYDHRKRFSCDRVFAWND